MIKSDQINELAAALAKAQSEYTIPNKDLINKHYNNKYPSLSSLIKATRPALSKNGLSIIQPVSSTQDAIHVTTILMHSSGQFIGDVLSLKPERPTPQGFGSAATYGKRYSYAGTAGVDAEEFDDDGNLASGIGDNSPSIQVEKRPAPADQPKQPAAEQKAIMPNPAKAGEVISEAQGKRLFAISKKQGWTLDDIKALLKTKYGVEHTRDIKRGDYEAICNIIEYQSPTQAVQRQSMTTYAPLPDDSSLPMDFDIPFGN